MKFSDLMKRVARRGVKVVEMLAAAHGADPEILGVAEDSRKVKAGDLFVARGGTRTSGEKFLEEATARGAAAVVLPLENAGHGVEAYYRMALARVEDVNAACAILAHEVAGNPTSGMKMIGVTGTKGKTTVAYLMRSVLKAAGFKVGMIGTVEIDDGVKAVPAEMTTPGAMELVELFCRMRENGVTHCVMEVSSHALHQRRVAGIDFAVAIFTNLTGDHLDYHKTMEEYAAAKAVLFEGLKEGAIAVVNADDEWAERMVRDSRARIVPYRVSTKLESGGASLQWPVPPIQGCAGLITCMSAREMMINVSWGGVEGFILRTPLVGKHNGYNLTSVLAAFRAMGVDDTQLRRGTCALNEAIGAPGRLERVELEGRQETFQVFVDYAHTHDALENVLTALRMTMEADVRGPAANMLSGHSHHLLAGESASRAAQHGTRARLICVFGCGGDRDRTKRPKMAAVAERLADRVIVTSDNPRTEEPGAILEEICAGFSRGWREGGKIRVEPDRRVAIRMAIEMAEPGDVVLIAGKGHENYQIIGTTKHHFDDVEEAEAALREKLIHHQEHQEHQGAK